MSPLQLVRVSVLGVPLLMAISATGFVPASASDPTLVSNNANSLPVETVQGAGQIDDTLSPGGNNFVIDDEGPAGSATPAGLTFPVELGTHTVEQLPAAGFDPVDIVCEDPTNDSSGATSSAACSGVSININISDNNVTVGGGDPTNNGSDEPADQPDDDAPDGQEDSPDNDGGDDPDVGIVPPRAGSQGDGPAGDRVPSQLGQVLSTLPARTVVDAPSHGRAQPGLDVLGNRVAHPAAEAAGNERLALTDLPRTGAEIQQAMLLGLVLLTAALVIQAALRRWSHSA